MWVWFSLQLESKTLLILIRIQRDIAINVKTSSCKVSVILVGFKRNLNFSPTDFRKEGPNAKFRKNPCTGSRVFFLMRKAWLCEWKIRFRQFCEKRLEIRRISRWIAENQCQRVENYFQPHRIISHGNSCCSCQSIGGQVCLASSSG